MGDGDNGLPVMPRTTTLDDPLTTSLLAEVARRSKTIEVSQEQIDEAMELEPAKDDGDGVVGGASPGGTAR